MDIHSIYLRYRFWILDFFKGSPIGKPYREIKVFDKLSFADGANKRERKLKQLLAFAQTNTIFYKNIKSYNLTDYPVINKQTLINHHKEIEVSQEVIPGQKGNIYIQKTSGSTGIPLEIPQDTLKRKRRIAELKYFGKRVGFNTHDLLIHLRIWNKWQTKSLKQIQKENIIPFDISDMGESRIKELCEIMKKEHVVALRGYASVIDLLATYVQHHPQCFPHLKIIISVSETLQDETRNKVKKYLKCEIISQYANEECGILAQEIPPTKPTDNIMYINHTGYYFEVLKMDSNEPCAYGELGRIVITDLHNYAFPLIRYDTGDVGVLLPPNERSKGYPVLGKLLGRKLDICYTTNGEPFSSMLLSRTLKHYDQIIQWQFIQKKEKEYCLKVIMQQNCDTNKYLESAISELLKVLGPDAIIKIEQVNEIPVLSSRKRKPVINEWKNGKYTQQV
ncbi:phenylacetate--CoA ligase family protein [Phocaeicola coprocola]|uniref:hypothetical protein n=1 Tax=Phocaeicola coprocola TaxID=310298 RepID=UPI00352009D0